MKWKLIALLISLGLLVKMMTKETLKQKQAQILLYFDDQLVSFEINTSINVFSKIFYYVSFGTNISIFNSD